MFYLLYCTSSTNFFFVSNSSVYNPSLSFLSSSAIIFMSSTKLLFYSIFYAKAFIAASLANYISIFRRCCISISSYLSFYFCYFFQLSNSLSSLMFISKSFILRYSYWIFSLSFLSSRRMAATLSLTSTSAYLGMGFGVIFFLSSLVCSFSTSSLILGRLVGLFDVYNSNYWPFLFS
jgi:hypothetical protein